MPTTINVTAQLYDSFVDALGDEIINLNSDQLYITLVTASYVPNHAADTYWSTPHANEASGSGYTAGGQQLTGTSWSGSAYSCVNPSWSNLTLSNVRYLVIYDKTSGTGPSSYRLVSYIDLGSAQNLSGQPLAITLPGGKLLTLLSGVDQLSTVTVANISDATAFGRQLLTATDAPTARALLGPSWPFPMARNTFACIGDSMAAAGSQGDETGRPDELQAYINATSFQMLQVLSHQRIRYCGGNYAHSNTTVADQLNLQLPFVLAMDPLPGACFLVCGAANMVEDAGYDFATCKGYVKSMVAQLLVAGIVPILWTIPPTYMDHLITAATYRPQLRQWNAWIRRYAALNGFPIVDAFTALADVHGVYLPGTSDDTLHPNAEGHKWIVAQAIADGLTLIFPPNSLVNTARETGDLTNLINDGTTNQGLHTVDSNSDGIADGLTQSGTSTNSLVTPAPTDQVLGKWQQITVAEGGNGALTKTISTGWSVGDTIAFSARVQTEDMVSGTGTFTLAVKEAIPGGYTLSDGSSVTALWNGLMNWLAADIDDGEVYVEFTIPPGTTQLSFWGWILSATTGSATLRFVEETIRNLTTGGLLT